MKRLLFLHGFLGSPSDWKSVIIAFQKNYEYSFQSAEAADVVIGYSKGGRKGLSLFQSLKAKKLILIASHPGLETQEEIEERRRFEAHWLRILEQESLTRFLELWYSLPLFNTLKEIPKERFSLSKEEIKRDFLDFSLTTQASFWNKIEIPFLYIVGEKDLKYRKIGEKLQSIYPQAEVKVLSDASHAVHLEKPREVAKLIETFIHRSHHA